MAIFDVRFKGDSKGLDDWNITITSDDYLTDLSLEAQHAHNIIDAAFLAFGTSYEVKKKDEQKK